MNDDLVASIVIAGLAALAVWAIDRPKPVDDFARWELEVAT